MSKSITVYVRGTFALILLGLGMYAGAESLVAHELANRGLPSCGAAANPCELAPLTVTVARSDAAPNAANAMQVLSVAPRAHRAHPVASAES
jgi:hypothetical protein